MVYIDRKLMFESKEAIEVRVKDTWFKHGFDVSFESYSVAQRLVDVWVELLWNNQEMHRQFYNDLSINAEGTALDMFVQRLGIERLNFPMLSHVWRNMPSSVLGKRFTFVRIPKEAIDETSDITGSTPAATIRYRERLGQGSVEIKGPLKRFVDQSRLLKDYGEPTEAGFEEDRLLVIEVEVFDVYVRIVTRTSEQEILCQSEPLNPFPGVAQAGKTFEYSASSGAVTYTNSDRTYYEIAETDDALRSRINTRGVSIAACESMLNKICGRSRVTLEKDLDKKLRYRITMLGFDMGRLENRRAFWNICDKYLPADFSLFQDHEENDEAVLIVDDSDDALPPRQGFIFIDNPSLLYIIGIDDPAQRNVLAAHGLPPIVSYATLFIALGNTFTTDLISRVRLAYNDGVSGRPTMLDRTEDHNNRAWISSRSTKERGSYFKAEFTWPEGLVTQ